FLRNEAPASPSDGEYFTIIDECVYTDANAQAIGAYLEATELLGKPSHGERALKALDFLWDHCRCADGGMFHYFDGTAHVPGLLNDQARMGTALLKAHRARSEERRVGKECRSRWS